MKPKTIFNYITLAVFICVTTQNADADGIGINFTGNSQFLQPTDQPGIVAGANWNNVNGASGSNVILNNSGGSSTTALLSFTSARALGNR